MWQIRLPSRSPAAECAEVLRIQLCKNGPVIEERHIVAVQVDLFRIQVNLPDPVLHARARALVFAVLNLLFMIVYNAKRSYHVFEVDETGSYMEVNQNMLDGKQMRVVGSRDDMILDVILSSLETRLKKVQRKARQAHEIVYDFVQKLRDCISQEKVAELVKETSKETVAAAFPSSNVRAE